MKVRSRVAWSVWGLVVVLATGLLTLVGLNRSRLPGTVDVALFWLIHPTGVAYATVGALILSRRGNRIGWIFSVVGFVMTFGFFAEQYAFRGAVVSPGSLPGIVPVAVLATLIWPVVTILGLLFLVFPTGRLPSPRWRPVAWGLFVGAAMVMLGFGLRPQALNGPWNDVGVTIANPIGVPELKSVLRVVWQAGVAIALAASLASVVALIQRFRRARGDERQQIKWLAFVAGAAAALFVTMILIGILVDLQTDSALGDGLWMAFFLTLVVGIPAAVTLSIMKYRLYEIDVVINKTLVYGALAAFITAVYVGVVVGVGTLAGTRDRGNLGLQIAATALVAVLFQPVRSRVQHLANRLVYGARATPYEVMAEFGDRMAGSLQVEEVLPQIAEAAARGVGAATARVRIDLPGGGTRESSWPSESGVGGAERVLPVIHRGEQVGEIAATKGPGDPLRPQDETLLRDLAAQAGLALHNVRLAEELRARVAEVARQAEELRRSQQRIVSAADDERRLLERTIEDRVERRIEDLAERLRMAADVLGEDPERCAATLEETGARAQATLEELRDIARGIYPPLLADQGLAAALDAQARRTDGVQLQVEGVGRYGQDVEAGVYFCCLEALQGRTGGLAIDLRGEAGGAVAFTIRHAGPADPQQVTRIIDRVDALGGQVTVDENGGTLISARIPAGTVAETVSP